jgi:hypothetical protein
MCRFCYRLFISVLPIVIPLTGLTPPHFCAYTKPEPGFPTWFFCVFIHLRREVIVHFVDIGVIVDHHCLNFFINIFLISNSLNTEYIGFYF